MVDDNKDRLGDKLKDLEKAREDLYAAEQDRILLEKLRGKSGQQQALKCPHCGRDLTTSNRAGVTFMACPQGAGVWLEKAAFERLTSGSK